ncbi:MAG: hypothetical protein WCX28_04165 [Bacteriovoracaceae bacterium]|nr:hypothetical protein [Bacteroidota bacterium]
MSKNTEEFNQFGPAIINAVWEKAENEFGFFFFKRDRFGDIIAKHHYGEQSQYGWEIECLTPDLNGSTYAIENLRPIHWKNASQTGKRQERFSIER